MDNQTLNQLIDGELPWEKLRNDVLPDPKDPDRFREMRDVLQDRVEWEDPILVPLNDHLYVVGNDNGRVVKAECGHVLCSAEENWKSQCEIRVRESKEEFAQLYPAMQTPRTDWTFQLREFFCPNCYTLVETNATPACYPVIQPFDPDIDTFYEDWLETTPPDKR